MTPKRFQRVKELYQRTYKRDPAEQNAFLQRACEGDEGLRAEVEALLLAGRRPLAMSSAAPAGTSFEAAPRAGSPGLLEAPAAELDFVPERVGRYRII